MAEESSCEWGKIMKDSKNRKEVMDMLGDAKKIGGQLKNRDALITV